jgi:hypothetical protein
MSEQTVEQLPWRVRRRFMVWVITFCMSVVSWVLYKEMTGPVAETAVTMSFLTIAGTIGSYVFGATWDNISKPR